MIRGRLVIPALNSLVAAALQPFPRIAMIAGHCNGCPATGIGWAVVPGRRGGFSAQHDHGCVVQ